MRFYSLLLVLSFISIGSAVTPLLEMAGPDAKLSATWRAKVLEWNVDTMVGAYQRVGIRNPAWDADAELLLNEWAYAFSGFDAGNDFSDVAHAAQILHDQHHVQDPLLLYCIAKTWEHQDRLIDAHRLYREAHKAFQHSNYPHCRRAWSTLRVIDQQIAKGKTDHAETGALVDLMADELIASRNAHEYGDLHRHFIIQVTGELMENEELTIRFLKRIAEATQANQPSWHRDTLLGTIEIALAWDARGSGWANSVTEDGWRDFRSHLANAEQLLTGAWKAAPEQPLAPTTMITVAVGINTLDDERTWFDRAVIAEFDYMNAYYSYMTTIRPRWGGSHDLMLAFGSECASTMRYDTNVPTVLVKAVLDIYGESKEMKQPDIASHLFANEPLWAEVDMSLLGLMSEQTTNAEWYQSLRASVAWKFGKTRVANEQSRELILERHGTFQKRALKLLGQDMTDLDEMLNYHMNHPERAAFP